MRGLRSYQLNILDEDGRLSHVLFFYAPDDRRALDSALFHCEEHVVELWHRHRLVARLLKGCEAA